MYSNKFPCPLLRPQGADHQPGFHQLCPICGWGTVSTSCVFRTCRAVRITREPGRGTKNYLAHGSAGAASAARRSPFDGEPRDEQWRPVDVLRDNIEEPQRGESYADSYPYADTTVLYYWRSTYWRRIVG